MELRCCYGNVLRRTDNRRFGIPEARTTWYWLKHFLFNSTKPETLRMYPPVSDIHRWVSKDYRLPNGSILPAETAVIIPALAFSRDPDIFPNPMQFDPSRFSPEAEAQRHPFSTLPFGEGNRICIGMRYIDLTLALSLNLDFHFFSPTLEGSAWFRWSSVWDCCWVDSGSTSARRQIIPSKLILSIYFMGQLAMFFSTSNQYEIVRIGSDSVKWR